MTTNLPVVTEIVPIVLQLQPAIAMTNEQFYDFCQLNRDFRIERNAAGELVIMPPTGSETDERNFNLVGQLWVWTEEFELVAQVNSTTSVISQPLTISHETQVATPSKNSTVKINTYNDVSSIKNQASNQPQSTFSQLAIYYFCGISLIIGTLLSSSTLGNPAVTWLIIIFVLACLVRYLYTTRSRIYS
ncbi:Uma2 family endonuclease [Nostoc sp. CCY 9925]|uniref:Uma2 family endonuclease n=1 Tax=Nostoc sp. CCY 9925 TaxID=3103865 RepID=UPI0039C5F102